MESSPHQAQTIPQHDAESELTTNNSHFVALAKDLDAKLLALEAEYQAHVSSTSAQKGIFATPVPYTRREIESFREESEQGSQDGDVTASPFPHAPQASPESESDSELWSWAIGELTFYHGCNADFQFA